MRVETPEARLKKLLEELRRVLVPGYYGKLEVLIKDGNLTAGSIVRNIEF